MLIALLYHKIGKGPYSNSLDALDSHFAYIASHYSTVLPGDPLSNKLAVCLTFDDALFDFYHLIFPLLKKYNLKAVLAVPTAFIPNQVSLSPEARLQKIAQLPLKHPPLPNPAYCSWQELNTLAQSPLIQIASHSLHHYPLTSPSVDPENELLSSKLQLEENLKIPINSFVYPYGALNSEVHTIAKKHYTYIFRIGNALNFSWHNTNKLLYRINADELPFARFPFTPLKHLKHFSRFLLNTSRGK